MDKLFIEDLELKGKRVLIRVDFNVPLDENQNITDDIRITAALPTIRKVISDGGKAVLMSHLGRPKGERIVGRRLSQGHATLKCQVLFGKADEGVWFDVNVKE